MNTILPQGIGAVSFISDGMAPIFYGKSYSWLILVWMRSFDAHVSPTRYLIRFDCYLIDCKLNRRLYPMLFSRWRTWWRFGWEPSRGHSKGCGLAPARATLSHRIYLLIYWLVLESQLPHKIVNLLFTITSLTIVLTVLWESWLAKTD